MLLYLPYIHIGVARELFFVIVVFFNRNSVQVSQRDTFYRKIISKSSCTRKESVEINIFIAGQKPDKIADWLLVWLFKKGAEERCFKKPSQFFYSSVVAQIFYCKQEGKDKLGSYHLLLYKLRAQHHFFTNHLTVILDFHSHSDIVIVTKSWSQ